MSEYRVIITPRAATDMEAIHDRIATDSESKLKNVTV